MIIIIRSDSVVGIAGRFGDLLPVGGEIFRTRPNRPRDPPSLLNIVHRDFPGGKRGRGVALTTNPHLALRLKQEHNYTSTAPVVLGRLQGEHCFFSITTWNKVFKTIKHIPAWNTSNYWSYEKLLYMVPCPTSRDQFDVQMTVYSDKFL